jgi:hypothetical protein
LKAFDIPAPTNSCVKTNPVHVRVAPSGITRLVKLTNATAPKTADDIDFRSLERLIGVGPSGVLFHTEYAAPAAAASTATIATSSDTIVWANRVVDINLLTVI